jgi:hypothetical protein
MTKIDLTKIENKLNDFDKKCSELNGYIDTKNYLENEIDKNYSIISKEKVLRNYHPNAIGSIFLYNQLNEKYNFYAESQFNKIIRFLEHIENKEKNYRDLYVECTKEYINKPNNIPISGLKKEEKEINDCYKLLLVLVTEVNGDKVKFNKVYNNLEDSGLFMTIPEKMNQKYLSDISTKLDNVIKGLEVIFESMEEANRALREIEENTGEISVNMYDVTNHLWDISWNVSSLNS